MRKYKKNKIRDPEIPKASNLAQVPIQRFGESQISEIIDFYSFT